MKTPKRVTARRPMSDDALARGESWTPNLTATPLADELEAERAMNDLGDVALRAAWRTEETLRAEMAALRARVVELERTASVARAMGLEDCGVDADAVARAEKAEAELADEREVADSLRTQLVATEAERDALKVQTAISDGPCVVCGESTQWAAADPSMWPVMLPTAVEPGIMKHHHTKCVLGWRALEWEEET